MRSFPYLRLSFFFLFQITSQSPSIIPSLLPDGTDKEDRIIGGTRGSIEDFPYQIILRVKGDKDAMCGGTMIAEKWFVTAAHCFDYMDTSKVTGKRLEVSDIEVLSGTYDLEHVKSKSSIEKIIRSPPPDHYNITTNVNDIALVRTRDSLAGQPAKLPLSDQIFVGRRANASGFGLTQENGMRGSRYLEYYETPILPDVICARDYSKPPMAFVSKSMICTGELAGGKGTCQGDSGGPVVVKGSKGENVLVGITSFGYGCGRKGFSSVETRVSSFVPFILKSVSSSDKFLAATSVGLSDIS